MGFPAFLYDFVEEEAYYSSMNFQKIAKGFGLETEDFWEPSMPYTRHTLCDYMDMVRYRLVNQSHQERTENQLDTGTDFCKWKCTGVFCRDGSAGIPGLL